MPKQKLKERHKSHWKDKKQNDKHNKHQNDKKDYSSQSQSRSRSRQQKDNSSKSIKNSRLDNKHFQITPNERLSLEKERIVEDKRPKVSNNKEKNKINYRVLGNIISDQKKMNKKLDQEETSRAANKFRQIFKEEIKPVTMSSYLSNEDLIKKIEEKNQQKQYNRLLCTVCYSYFKNSEQLERHTQYHSK